MLYFVAFGLNDEEFCNKVKCYERLYNIINNNDFRNLMI